MEMCSGWLVKPRWDNPAKLELWISQYVAHFFSHHAAILPSDSAHADLSCNTTELWEIPVFSPSNGAIILHTIK